MIRTQKMYSAAKSDLFMVIALIY